MFIDFEGIDGSGKTTLSNRLATRLAKQGVSVTHAREGGELQAPLARRVRELTRDAQLLEMCPQAEFFLNLAREAQQLEEVIRPALQAGQTVISDRFVYSQLALTGAGRGLTTEALAPCAQLAAQGVWPDLVILVDVDPELARLRKRLDKLQGGKRKLANSRKGLAGAGLNVRVRQHLLDMARADPDRWRIVDNGGRPLWEVEDEIAQIVLGHLGGERASRSSSQTTSLPAPATLATLETCFFQTLDEVQTREPALAAYLLAGVGGARAHQRRLELAEHFAPVIGRGLEGLFDEESFQLRHILKTSAPSEVIRSLSGQLSEQALSLRQELFGQIPADVVSGLKLDDGVGAWGLREGALELGLLAEVLWGLRGVDSPRSWELRANGLREGLFTATARSLEGLVRESAEESRRVLLARDRLAVLESMTGIDTPLAQQARRQWFDKAPKVVLRSLRGVDAPYADELREKAAPLTKEALDSVDGMDTPFAWSLRERFFRLWPSTAISSLKGLARSSRGTALLETVLREFPTRMPVLRNAYAEWMRPTVAPTRASPDRPSDTVAAVLE